MGNFETFISSQSGVGRNMGYRGAADSEDEDDGNGDGDGDEKEGGVEPFGCWETMYIVCPVFDISML